jgi:Tol biopolymer transport system component
MASRNRIGQSRDMSLVASIGVLIVSGLCSVPFDAAQDDAAPCVIGSVENLGPGVNSPFFEGSPTVSANDKTLFFTSNRVDGQEDLFVSTRQRRKDPWGEAVNLGPPVNTPTANENGLRLSLDGKAVYFSSNRPGGLGRSDLYVATRKSKNHPWSAARNLGPLINTELFEGFPTPSADHTTLYFNRSTTFDSPDSDIWVTTRSNRDEPWGIPERLAEPINGPSIDVAPSISADGLTLYFASQRPGNIGFLDIWVARRTTTSSPWGPPENLGPNVNTPFAVTLAPFISANGRRLYFMSTRLGGFGGSECGFFNCFDSYVVTLTCSE